MDFCIAIMGTGKSAEKMAQAVNETEGVTAYAVASRDKERAKKFALSFQFEKAYGSYEEMLKDDKIDLVYIATPHSFHHEHMLSCFRHGKNVMCEKLFTTSYHEAKETLLFAEEQRIFVAEAVSLRYMPIMHELQSLIAKGVIGKIHLISAYYGKPVLSKVELLKKEKSGGAMYHLVPYPLHFISMCMQAAWNDPSQEKQPYAVCYARDNYSTDVELQNTLTLVYPGHILATAVTTMYAEIGKKGILYGDKGKIVVDNIKYPQRIEVYNEQGKELLVVEGGSADYALKYPLEAAKQAIRNGHIQCDELPHQEILQMIRILS
ncbi:MAG: Gfo/Idh/MocA family oxidoreductase [Lachnospiraceae bacterium]|nr:Gfo/Idh/MocA family oxidoreductase [Lachnospiraceae bacterium]